jgi:hypothetical protein
VSFHVRRPSSSSSIRCPIFSITEFLERRGKMKAAYYEGSKTIRIGTCVRVPPSPGSVQIKVSYCGVCGTDLHVFHGRMDHIVKVPQVIGREMSGVISGKIAAQKAEVAGGESSIPRDPDYSDSQGPEASGAADLPSQNRAVSARAEP